MQRNRQSLTTLIAMSSIGLLGFGTLCLSGCGANEPEPAEEAVDSIGDAADDAADATEDAADEIGDATEKAADEVKDAMESESDG